MRILPYHSLNTVSRHEHHYNFDCESANHFDANLCVSLVLGTDDEANSLCVRRFEAFAASALDCGKRVA